MGQKDIKREIRKYLDTNENKNMTYQNLWTTANVVLRGIFIVINAYIQKEKSQINNLTSYFNKLEKEKLSSKSAK